MTFKTLEKTLQNSYNYPQHSKILLEVKNE